MWPWQQHEKLVGVTAIKLKTKKGITSKDEEKLMKKLHHASNRIRTDDLHITSVAPYQLGHRSSYDPTWNRVDFLNS